MWKPVRAFILSALLACAFNGTSQSRKLQSQAVTLKRVIEREHYSPRPVNDAFSASLYDEFLERIDPYKLYFTADDAKQLSVFRQQLDDELNGSQWNFLDKFLLLYKERLKKTDTLVNTLLQKPFDLTVAEKLALTPDSLHYAANDQQFKLKWQKWLKYQTLDFLAGICEMRRGDAKSCLQYEPQAREKTKAAELRNIKKTLQHPSGYENYIASIYCETIANLFDPHTAYMPKTEKEAFETQMGAEGLYFGLSVMENAKGEIELAQIMPGSPAWKSGELNPGDIIVQLAWEGKEPINTDGASAEEISGILDQANTSRLDITVRKADGVVKTIPLVKEVIHNDDHVVKGFILKGERSIGYIYLPAFYTPFEGSGESSCANDVAKEIVKLKKENIQGLILDVRYNGGGSMQEALNMAGIFIEDGPLALLKGKDAKAITVKDMNRGTIYDGPLLLLVNGQSASASELLAAVLQDYNRAVVAGGNTFGKGTAQVILPVDTSRTGKGSVITDMDPQHGYVKLTVLKFYRVNGSTTQHQGVKPDISLPEIFDELDYSESLMPNALAADTTKRNQYYKPLTALPVSVLKQKSESRVAAIPAFEKLRQAGALLKKQQNAETGMVPLKWSEYFTGFHASIPSAPGTATADKPIAGKYEADNTLFDKQKINTNAFEQTLNNQWKQRLLYDIYIQEACNILNDLILLTGKQN
ncbi:MAG: carboxy terminal-processing peptidase [Chitinophagaceae bacterium]